MRRRHPVLLLALVLPAALLAGAAGCGDDFEDDYHLVKDLRLLAVKAEPPEVRAGDPLAVTTLAVAPGAEAGSAIAIQWFACALPALPGLGTVNERCLTEDLAAPHLIALGAGPALHAVVPSLPREALGFPDVTGGVYLPLRLRLATAAQSLDAVYRLRVSTSDANPPNQNPSLAGVFLVARDGEGQVTGVTELLEDQPPLVRATDKVTLRCRFTEASAEAYSVDLGDGMPRPATEQLNASWFATAGHFDNGSTGPDVDTVLDLERSPPAAGTAIDVWVVGRDERGGSDHLHRVLRVH